MSAQGPSTRWTGKLQKDLCQAQHHPKGHQEQAGLLDGREGALMEGSLGVWAGALDQLAWTYFNIPAIGEVTVIHSIVDVSRGEGRSKVELEEDSTGSMHFTHEPAIKEGPAQAHGLNTLNPGTPGETTMTWRRVCHTEEWGHCHFKRNVVSL